MPEQNRPAYQVAEDIANVTIDALVTGRVDLNLECEGCYRKSIWDASYLAEHFGKVGHTPVWILAQRLRCSACRGRYVRVWRVEAPAGASTPDSTGRA